MSRNWIIDTKEMAGKKVVLYGWVNKRRDHGKIVFIDLRDKTGIIQVVVSLHNNNGQISDIRNEWVIKVEGMVKERSENLINKKLETGHIEIEAEKVEVISASKTPPFEVDKDTIKVEEETRLKYRYLDLRTERMKNNLNARHRFIKKLRDDLDKERFISIETPILSKSTPEGARDYLVPSRLHPGKFYALPQSPQQYKQLLMVAGIERYFQIAPCFRDEDARSDRSPGDFYQLDIEMSFVNQEEILNLTEKIISTAIKEIFPELKIKKSPWPRLDHKDSMEKYKSDKPDLRQDKNDKSELAFAWIIDFPLFVKQTKENYFHGAGEKWAPSHHMFTKPKNEDIKLLDQNPAQVRSYQHDLVLNGYEVGGGSVRIHDPKMQEKIFDLIGFTKKDKDKFMHILNAFSFGVPPHGGIAVGIERLLMILLNQSSLREVMAFPLTGDGRDPLLDAPSCVDKKQLDDLSIALKEDKK